MTTEEVREMSGGQVAFLPWLQLRGPLHIAGIDFVPYKDKDGRVNDVFRDADTSLTMVFSSYVDRESKPVQNLVVAVIPGRGWDLRDEDFDTVSWAARLLFLACFAANEYFSDGNYTNSIPFRPVGQRFSGGPFIAITSRRRDGSSMNGGYKHGEVKFSLPIQCRHDWTRVDEDLLKALDAANASGKSKTIEALRTALPYVELANTDDELMNAPPEAILMASAFEQLLEGEAQAYTLGKNFGELFKPYGTVTVADALKVRPKIKIDTSKPEYAAAQPGWWTHRKWIEELYGLRNESAHEGTIDSKDRAWSAFEHLVIAAFVFPLAVKLRLQKEGFYKFPQGDKTRAKSVDKLLAADRWNRQGHESAAKWVEIVQKTHSDGMFDVVTEAVDEAVRKETLPSE